MSRPTRPGGNHLHRYVVFIRAALSRKVTRNDRQRRSISFTYLELPQDELNLENFSYILWWFELH